MEKKNIIERGFYNSKWFIVLKKGLKNCYFKASFANKLNGIRSNLAIHSLLF